MTNKQKVAGVAAGAAILSAAYYLSKNNRLNWKGVRDTAGEIIDGLKHKFGSAETNGIADHGGTRLAKSAQRRASQNISRGEA